MTIVIPARNAGDRLHAVLNACLAQDYEGPWEIIVIDNCSVDQTRAIAVQHPPVRLLNEAEHIASPYSARNRAIEVAGGEIVALLDATCVPRSDWLRRGIARMSESAAGLVAGEVRFAFAGDRPTPAELWDSVSNIQQATAVERGSAKTANLFVHRTVIAEQGRFREGVRSGEDVRWTSNATAAGWQLIYATDAVVEKSARGARQLLRKAARTGAGKAGIMSPGVRVVRGVGSLLVPPSILRVRRVAHQRCSWPIDTLLLVRLWLVAWSTRLAHGLGMLLPAVFERAD